MKAHPVLGLDADMPLEDAARRIVAVRAAELWAFVPEALEERSVTVMHDMRIAAKRLRYLLDLVGFCFADVGEEARERAKALQEVLGDIHDCDVMLERIAGCHDLEPQGFGALEARTRARRGEVFTTFMALWSEIETSRLRDRLLATTFSSPPREVLSA